MIIITDNDSASVVVISQRSSCVCAWCASRAVLVITGVTAVSAWQWQWLWVCSSDSEADSDSKSGSESDTHCDSIAERAVFYELECLTWQW